jgi:hypothetical protein
VVRFCAKGAFVSIRLIDLKKTVLVIVPTSPDKNKQEEYPQERWREAFNRYLDHIWTQSIYYSRGALVVGGIVLVRDPAKSQYKFEDPMEYPTQQRPEVMNIDMLTTKSDDMNKVEISLARFIRSPHVRMLVIEFPHHKFYVWKGEKRTDLFATLERNP